jgi:hypothetical protein
MIYGIKFTITRLAGRNDLISPDALAAYNEVLLEKKYDYHPQR